MNQNNKRQDISNKKITREYIYEIISVLLKYELNPIKNSSHNIVSNISSQEKPELKNFYINLKNNYTVIY